jgi:hypothetical protein
MKYLRKILLTILIVIAIPISFIVMLQVWYYASCPVYTFKEPQPFSGRYIYNPYADVKTGEWRKAVFHAHAKSWGGLTNGGSSSEEVWDAYVKLGYDVIAISNYMSIDTLNQGTTAYIPTYEHGYNIPKTHQHAMNAHVKPLWRDYIFRQNLSQKQHIIDLLKERSETVAVNHPAIRSGYWPQDFKYLSGYDLFEVLNGAHNSIREWDSAFSYGHTAWLTANDDSHGIANPAKLHVKAVFINSPAVRRSDILGRIGTGAALGVDFPKKGQTFEQKQGEAQQVSFPKSISVRNDTLFVVWEKEMKQITFVGNYGKTLKMSSDCDSAWYPVQPDDMYVRTELVSPEGFTYFLNPVVRSHDGNMPGKQRLASVDAGKTLRKRIISGVASVLVVAGFVILKRRSKRKNNFH